MVNTGARGAGGLVEESGFAAVATIDQVREYNYTLSPGRSVGSEGQDKESEPFEEWFPTLLERLQVQFKRAHYLQTEIRSNLEKVELELCGQSNLPNQLRMTTIKRCR